MSLDTGGSLMVMVMIPANDFGLYLDRLAVAAAPPQPPPVEPGMADTFHMMFSARVGEATEAAATGEGDTRLVERIWEREIDGICELARVLLGLGD